MGLEDVLVGTSVLVRLDYGDPPHRQGSVGTIKKRYGTPDYRAFKVLFPDGQTGLFWDHMLDEVKGDPSLRTERMWVFWQKPKGSPLACSQKPVSQPGDTLPLLTSLPTRLSLQHHLMPLAHCSL